jgi:hypothetical protein
MGLEQLWIEKRASVSPRLNTCPSTEQNDTAARVSGERRARTSVYARSP